MASEIVTTIAEQVMAGIEPASRHRFKLISVDENTLRVHLKLGKRVLNTDITYEPGPDTYSVKRHKMTGPYYADAKTDEFEGVYCDQLAEIAGGL